MQAACIHLQPHANDLRILEPGLVYVRLLVHQLSLNTKDQEKKQVATKIRNQQQRL